MPPLEMTKWFDTNYHFLVPEVGPGTRLRLAGSKPLAEYAEARSLGIETRPVLLGPLSFLLLAKPAERSRCSASIWLARLARSSRSPAARKWSPLHHRVGSTSPGR